MQAELIIIGGGASGTAMLQALAAAAQQDRLPRRLRRGRVVLLERTAELGPGLPYGETADPQHTMGRTRTLRRAKGQQLAQRFQEAHAQLVAAGLELVLHPQTPAQSIAAILGGWQVGTDGLEVESSQVVLATGHWHVPRLQHLERAVDWRWDVRRLHSVIADDEDVVVLGMGQSGLDVATALAGRRQGRAGAGVVRLASRLGLLPGVFGHVGGKQVATRPLEALLSASEVRLDALFEAVREGEAAVAGHALESPRRTPQTLRASLQGVDGVSLLRSELAVARRSMELARPIPWHPVLWHGLAAFHALLPRLCAEDRLELAAHWTPIMRHVEAIHLSSAARLLGFIESGAIEVHALGEAPRLEEDARGVVVRGTKGEVRAARIVDARGPDPRLPLSDAALVRSLLDEGHLATGRIPFKAPASPDLHVPEGWSVERGPAQDWLITGGLWVAPDTFAALDPAGQTHGLFALGPLTLGQFPFYAGLWATRQSAARIVAALPRDRAVRPR